MEPKFKIGQKVYDDVRYPGIEGVVIDVIEGDDYPIWVSFIIEHESYTLEGRWREICRPTLFPFPYTFNPVEALVTHDTAENYGQAKFD